MKRLLFLVGFLSLLATAAAQRLRPDAFPPLPDPIESKGLTMASTLEEMREWNRYPTYGVYVEMMRDFEQKFPSLCHLDTIGTSVDGRLILCLRITGSATPDTNRPEFFYSATMHGDELTGFYLMLRLCDTLLNSYGTSARITHLMDSTCIFINPLSNPDGAYFGGDGTVNLARRYNANGVDLNRNYPDPFGTPPLDTLQPENTAMIDYVSRHHFRMGANLHGGSEVLNYPWDSFTSSERACEHSDWWKRVCRRFIDTLRIHDSRLYRNVEQVGYVAGGDWYVISNGRQDYFNYVHHLRELTMEVSTTKKLPNGQLTHYWECHAQSLLNYIGEIHTFEQPVGITESLTPVKAYPNPTRGPVTIETPKGCYHFDLGGLGTGLHLLHVEGKVVKVVKLP